MTHADVQLRSHRDEEVERWWQREEQNLAPTPQLPSCDGINDQRQEDQRGQCRLDNKRHREVEPHTMGIDLPEDIAGPAIGYRADIGQSVEPRLGQELPARHDGNSLAFERTQVSQRAL